MAIFCYRHKINIAERIREYVHDLEIEFNQEKISATLSIGLVCDIIENDTINIENIIHKDYKNLYYAKNHRENQICACEYYA